MSALYRWLSQGLRMVELEEKIDMIWSLFSFLQMRKLRPKETFTWSLAVRTKTPSSVSYCSALSTIKIANFSWAHTMWKVSFLFLQVCINFLKLDSLARKVLLLSLFYRRDSGSPEKVRKAPKDTSKELAGCLLLLHPPYSHSLLSCVSATALKPCGGTCLAPCSILFMHLHLLTTKNASHISHATPALKATKTS